MIEIFMQYISKACTLVSFTEEIAWSESRNDPNESDGHAKYWPNKKAWSQMVSRGKVTLGTPTISECQQRYGLE
jgi:hypothetical protein